MRVSIVVAVSALLGAASVLAQSDHEHERPVILYTAVSADGATLHASGSNFPRDPFVTLGGITLGGIAVVSDPDVDRLTALMPALPPGSYRLRLSDAIFDRDAPDTHSLVSFDMTIGVAGTSGAQETTTDGQPFSEQRLAD
jgi:hypothetical protein